MLTRITTNGVLRGYKSNLMRSGNNLNDARNKVLSKRNFNSYAEDPAAATKAFQLRRAHSRASDQISNSTTVINRFESAWGSMGAVTKALYGKASAVEEAISAVSDTAGDARSALAKSLSGITKEIVQDLNVKYGDSFLFAGADGRNVPFTWDEGKLLYRGISVDAGGVQPPVRTLADGTEVPLMNSDGTPVTDGDLTAQGYDALTQDERDAIDVYQKDQADYKKLQAMAAETNYVDLGMGLQENADGSFITSSGYDYAISGLEMLGYGTDADGDPKNVVSIIQRLSDIFSRCDPNFQDGEKEEADRLLGKLQDSVDHVQSQYVELDSKAKYLKSNKERLAAYATTLNEEILSIEQVDLADAITEFSWAQYCYNAALKVGNSILSQSLIDYMG